jgi:hypothetical protein
MFAQAQTSVVFEEWAESKGVQEFFYKNVTVTDVSNNVYVAGATLNGDGNYDLLISKFDKYGVHLWSDTVAGAGGGHDMAAAIAIDAEGDVLVCGTISAGGSEGNNMLLVKYDTDGFEYWRYSYDNGGNDDAAVALCFDGDNDIYLTGGTYNSTSLSDMLTIKVDRYGNLVWDETFDYNSLYDLGVKIALSGSRVVVTGGGQYNFNSFVIVALSYTQSDGSLSGGATIGGTQQTMEEVSDLYVDGDDNIYISGSVINSSYGYDFKIIKLDEDLNVLWTQTWDGQGLNDYSRGVKVAPNGDVYVCGTTATTDDGDDMVLLKYSSGGNLYWAKTYNGNYRGDDRAETLEYHPDGFIYVAGSSFVVSNMDYLTLKYNTSGDLLWEINYNSPYNKNDRATNMAIDSDGDIIVTGQCERDSVLKTYYAVKYVERTVISPQSSEIIPSSAHFTPNVGQIKNTEGNLAGDVVFVNRNDYPTIFVQNDKLTYVLSAIDTTSIDSLRQDTLHRVDMVFNKQNNNQRFYPLGEKPYFENYYLGHMEQFAERVHPYEQLVSFEVYDDIDVIVSNNNAGLKYYFVCKPGFNLGKLSWTYDGADTVLINNDALEIHTSLGTIIHPQADAWQIDGNGDVVSLAWQPDYENSNGNFSFSLGSFNTAQVLIIAIDKGTADAMASTVPEWGTYFGGNSIDHAYDLKVRNNGEFNFCGLTESTNFPVFGQSIFQEEYGGNQDAFVGCFNPDYSRKWVTYYGGGNSDRGYGVGVDNVNDLVYLCGVAGIDGWHPYNLALASNPSCYADNSSENATSKGFIVRLNNADGVRQWATLFGNSLSECRAIACDANGNVYVIGNIGANTPSIGCDAPLGGGFTICNPGNGAFVQSQHNGEGIPFIPGEGFVAKFNSSASLEWSTFLGGSNDESLNHIVVDNVNSKIFIVGSTKSVHDINDTECEGGSGFPLCSSSGYFQNELNGNDTSSSSDGFICSFSFSGQMNWSTYFGGLSIDFIRGAALNSENELYISGYTTSSLSSDNNCNVPTNSGFPTCSNGTNHSQDYSGSGDAFIAQFDESFNLKWSTFIGGNKNEQPEENVGGLKVTVDDSDNVYLFGVTNKSNTEPYPNVFENGNYNQSTHADLSENTFSMDCFVSGFDSNGILFWSTFYGGIGMDVAGNIGVFEDKILICGGTMSSQNFPLACPGQGDPYCQNNGPALFSRHAFFAQLKVGSSTNIFENIVERTDKCELVVFPNPTNEKFWIRTKNKTDYIQEITAFNSIGKQIYSRAYAGNDSNSELEMDLSFYPSGIYLFNIKTNNENCSIKVIKH